MQPFSDNVLKMKHIRLNRKSQQLLRRLREQDLTLGMLRMMDSSNTASRPCRASRVETDHLDGGLSRNRGLAQGPRMWPQTEIRRQKTGPDNALC